MRGTLRGENQIRYVAAEPAACPTLTRGVYAYDFGDTVGLTPLMPMYTLGHDFVPPPGARRRPALPRRRADALRAGQGGRRRGARVPPERDVRGRRAVRAHRGHHPRARARARDPRGDRGGRGGQAGRRGAHDPVRPLRPRQLRPRGLRRVPGRRRSRTRSSPRRICRRRSTRCRRTCRRSPKRRRTGMRQDIEFDAEGNDAAGVVVRPRRCDRPGADDRDVPRLQRGQGAVPRRVRRGVLRRRASARSSTTTATSAPVDGEPRQEIDPWAQIRDYRHAITYARTLRRGRRRPDRDLGLELQRRARARRRRDRPPREVRRRAGAADQRPRERAPAGPRGPDRADAGDVRGRPRGPLPRRGAGDDPGRRARGRAVRAADGRLLRVVHDQRRRARAVVDQRVHAAQRRDVPGVRAGHVPAVDLTDAAADGRRRAAIT